MLHSIYGGLELVPKAQRETAVERFPPIRGCSKNTISCSMVEIMMALEEKLGLSIGEGGAENIAEVPDAADLIERE
ncbi:hypothetical protein RHSIM_Rhsim08G0242100 [Rhododendron simsii]|uniref:Uncharacterized protein n=1 Tax=Rhododendron simsii TaxID=118357 RepID=A0A834LHZ4_RHOSS|nr:hypothetical protein RHSIM_Rhsim08G0242100 [Rhododendron simsii]